MLIMFAILKYFGKFWDAEKTSYFKGTSCCQGSGLNPWSVGLALLQASLGNAKCHWRSVPEPLLSQTLRKVWQMWLNSHNALRIPPQIQNPCQNQEYPSQFSATPMEFCRKLWRPEECNHVQQCWRSQTSSSQGSCSLEVALLATLEA